MTRRTLLVVTGVAVGVALSTFFYLASAPLWEVRRRGVLDTHHTRESLFTVLRNQPALASDDRLFGDSGIAERNAAETWKAVGIALAAGVGSVPVYLVLRVYVALVTAPVRPSSSGPNDAGR